MKRLFGFLFLAAALLVACEQQEQPSSNGKAVRFTTAVNTKTSFQGYTQNGVEAILWENGDAFTVWSDQASVSGSSQKWADYKVVAEAGVATAVNPVTEGVELLWGQGLHQFYAVYPSGKLHENIIKANIPDYQIVKETENNVFVPVLSEYGYMYASAQAKPDDGSVNLAFSPLFNSFEFIVSPGNDTDVLVSGFRLEVQNGSKQTLAGDFQATLSPDSNPEVDIDYSNAKGSVNLQFGDHRSIKVAKGTTLTFSVITYPVAMSHLTAVFTVDGKEIALPLADKKGNYFNFPAGEKARIRALGALGPEAQAAGITVVLNGQNVNDFDVSTPGEAGVVGLLPGVFTIGDKKVRFSKGNLQAVLENGAITKWQFAENQWETAGDAWSLTNDTGTVGRFLNSTTAPLNRWGTHTLDFHTIEAGIDGAYMTITPEAEQLSNDYYIGSALQLYDNPDFASTYGSGWEYLTYEMILGEYDRTEQGSHGAYTDYYIARAAPARVEGVNGVVLLPDDYVQPAGIPLLKTDYVRYDSGGSGLAVALVDEVNDYTSAQWAEMENAGAVFIPAGYYYKGSEDVTLNAIINHRSGSTQHIVIESNGKYFGTTLYAHPTSPGLVRLVKVVE